MFYREEVINGVLCYKVKPTGRWIEFTSEELTSKLEVLEEKLYRLKEESGLWE